MRGHEMIQLNVLTLLEKSGKTKYWLWKQLGMSYQSYHKMVHNQTRSISYRNIEALCVIFNVTPNELFAYDFEANSTE